MDSKKGYWQRQAYLLSSIGLFYIILIGLFAIPLLGAFVVILIQGAMNLRYVIIAAGCIGALVLGVFLIKSVRTLWRYLRSDGFAAGEAVRSSLADGKPVEISIFSGLIRFTCGTVQSDARPALAHSAAALLPHLDAQNAATDMIEQLQELSELKRSGDIDADEFEMLKGMLLQSASASETTHTKDSS